MVRHTQTIRRLLPMNCLSVLDHFVGLVLKGLKIRSIDVILGSSLLTLNSFNIISAHLSSIFISNFEHAFLTAILWTFFCNVIVLMSVYIIAALNRLSVASKCKFTFGSLGRNGENWNTEQKLKLRFNGQGLYNFTRNIARTSIILGFHWPSLPSTRLTFTYSKSAIATPEQCTKSVAFIFNFEKISNITLAFPLLTLNK